MTVCDLIAQMRDVERRVDDWETIMDIAADKLEALVGTLKEIANGGFIDPCEIATAALAKGS